MKVTVIGKGRSYAEWKESDADLILCLNSVIEKVRRGVLVQRDLGPVFDVPPECGILAPLPVVQSYGRGTPYTWGGIPKSCSGVTAIRYAYMLGSRHVTLCGFDNLVGDPTYHPTFRQQCPTADWEWGLEQQLPQFGRLDPCIKEVCWIGGRRLSSLISFQWSEVDLEWHVMFGCTIIDRVGMQYAERNPNWRGIWKATT